ncbi:hypothetical protein GCM10027568_18840 [Humibacter soli]
MSAHTAERRLSRAGDAELITLTRKGDSAAYAALFRRHASAAAAVARSVTSTFDPDDLVSEAYTRVLNALKSGNGPTAAFRPYLFTTVRNVAASWGRSSANTVALDPEEFEELELDTDDPLAAIDRSLTAKAFRSLPARWQEALWYSEVEGMTPARIAPLVGLSAQATAALCYRAREGLRQAWIRAHLTSPDLSPECSWTVDRLAARTRGRLGKREQSRVEAHLATCAKCTMVAEEAKDVGDRLALVLLPLAIGAAGATAYLATLHGGTAGVVAGAAGAGAAAGAGTSASSAAGGSGGAAGGSAGTATGAGSIFSGVTGIVIGSAAAVVVVGAAAVAGVAIFATPAAHSDTTSVDAGSASSSTTSNGSTAQTPTRSSPAPSPSPSATPTLPAPLAPRAAPPAGDQSASTDPGASSGGGTSADPGSSTNPGTPAAPSSPSTPTAPSTPTGPSTPSGPGTSTPGDPGTPPADPEPPAAPSIGTVDTGDGKYFPLVSGSAAPGATVTVSGAGSTVTVQADASGAWRLDSALDGYGAGTGTVSVTQTDPATGLSSAATTSSFALTAPQASAHGLFRQGGFFVEATVSGAPKARVELLVDGASRDAFTLNGAGRYTDYLLVGPGTHTVETRYADGAGRVGPGSQTSIAAGL